MIDLKEFPARVTHTVFRGFGHVVGQYATHGDAIEAAIAAKHAEPEEWFWIEENTSRTTAVVTV